MRKFIREVRLKVGSQTKFFLSESFVGVDLPYLLKRDHDIRDEDVHHFVKR